MLPRIMIDNVGPRTRFGDGPAKTSVGESVPVTAWIYRDGHEVLGAEVRWRHSGDQSWAHELMHLDENDEWSGCFTPIDIGLHEFVVDVWVERDGRPDPHDRAESAVNELWVDRPLGRSSAWYELFPRSEGGLDEARKRIPAIAAMGFDIIYLPPVHPIGVTKRKGRDNSLDAGPDDPGSPWAIGSAAGGHTAVEPSLGTIDDFDRFVAAVTGAGMEIALDFALQCSPDHPWVSEHPEWFFRRPDGSIRFAENPPKKYEDIFPINFWPVDADGSPDDAVRAALWDACADIVRFWIGHGVHVFRVDNPHTKPVAFWAWLIPLVHAEHPDIVFLAEAFTRPKPMAKLAEVGFTQGYTYFTWRHSRDELVEYVNELAFGPDATSFRPNFWPSTPDILGGVLRHGNRAAFQLRAVLAATLVPNWGIYSGYELCENEPASDTNEEYARSEKYEIKHRDWHRPDSLEPFLGALNRIRRAHPAFAELSTVSFRWAEDEALLAFTKTAADGSDPVLVVVNLDPEGTHSGTVDIDFTTLGFGADEGVMAHDELSGQVFEWPLSRPSVQLDPTELVAHVVSLKVPGSHR